MVMTSKPTFRRIRLLQFGKPCIINYKYYCVYKGKCRKLIILFNWLIYLKHLTIAYRQQYSNLKLCIISNVNKHGFYIIQLRMFPVSLIGSTKDVVHSMKLYISFVIIMLIDDICVTFYVLSCWKILRIVFFYIIK